MYRSTGTTFVWEFDGNYFLKIANSGKFIYSKIKILDKPLHSPNLLLRVFLGLSGGGVGGGEGDRSVENDFQTGIYIMITPRYSLSRGLA